MTAGKFDFQWGNDGPSLGSAVFQTLGFASVCWDETPSGVFDSSAAKDAGDKLLAWILENYTFAPNDAEGITAAIGDKLEEQWEGTRQLLNGAELKEQAAGTPVLSPRPTPLMIPSKRVDRVPSATSGLPTSPMARVNPARRTPAKKVQRKTD